MPAIRHAWRGLRRAPTVSVAAVVCLALGIGAATAIFSAFDVALLRAPPLRAPGALITVYRTTPHFDTGPFAPANFLDLRSGTRSLQALAAVTPGSALLEGGDEPVQVAVGRASGDLFPLLGVPARHGRLLSPEDERAEAPAVALLSAEFWRERFGADRGIVGRTLRLDGDTYEIIGVLPDGFRLPHGGRSFSPDLWTALRFSPQQATARRSNYLLLLGRARDGVSAQAVDAELRGVMAGIIEAHPELEGEQLRAVPLVVDAASGVRAPLTLLLGAVGFVLLIAVANVASLLLARGAARQREIAVRAALGAGRWEAIRGSLAEGALIAVTGSVWGLLLAGAGVRLIGTLAAERVPQLAGLGIDLRVMSFGLALGALAALACSLAPAWRAAHRDPQEALRAGGRTGGSPGHHRFLRGLVAVEVGLSLILLLGAGLVLRGFGQLLSRDPGFDPDPLLTLTASVSPGRYGDVGTIDGFLLPALEALAALPGVQAAGSISALPYRSWGINFNARYEGRPADDPTRLPLVEVRSVDPALFAALGIPLLRGRMLEPSDLGPEAPQVMVVNQALAVRDFPGEDPLGRRLVTGDSSFATIVGVVGDVRNSGPYREPRPEMYFPVGRRDGSRLGSYNLVVRVGAGDPTALLPQVTAALRTVDPGVAVSRAATMREVIAESVGQPRLYLSLLGAFAGVALLLAVAGLYGVMSYSVAQRTREMGIRHALGSRPGQTISHVMRDGLTVVGLGLLAGLLGGYALTRFVESLLYGVSRLDLATWALATIALAGAAALAILVPARRASTVDPMEALREG